MTDTHRDGDGVTRAPPAPLATGWTAGSPCRMPCYYIVISSTHLSNGHFRSVKGVFQGPLSHNGSRNLDYAKKERAEAVGQDDPKACFYCQLCDKQYQKHQEFDNHINSYDHAHKQRLKELKQREFARNVASRCKREERRQERVTRRLRQLAEQRRKVQCAPGSGPMFRSTTVAVEATPTGGNWPASPADEGTQTGPSGDGRSMAWPLPGRARWQAHGQRVVFSFNFPKKASLRLESSAAVFSQSGREDDTQRGEIRLRETPMLGTPGTSDIEIPRVGHEPCHAYTQAPHTTKSLQTHESSPSAVEAQKTCSTQTHASSHGTQEPQRTDDTEAHWLPNTLAKSHCPSPNPSSVLLPVQSPHTSPVLSLTPTSHKLLDHSQDVTDHSPARLLAGSSLEDNSCLVAVSTGSTETEAGPTEGITQGADSNGGLRGENCTPIASSVFDSNLTACPGTRSPQASAVKAELLGQMSQPEPLSPSHKPSQPFCSVLSRDGNTVLLWPSEMLAFTKTAPSLSYSCNPLHFDFRAGRAAYTDTGEHKAEFSDRSDHDSHRNLERLVEGADYGSHRGLDRSMEGADHGSHRGLDRSVEGAECEWRSQDICLSQRENRRCCPTSRRGACYKRGKFRHKQRRCRRTRNSQRQKLRDDNSGLRWESESESPVRGQRSGLQRTATPKKLESSLQIEECVAEWKSGRSPFLGEPNPWGSQMNQEGNPSGPPGCDSKPGTGGRHEPVDCGTKRRLCSTSSSSEKSFGSSSDKDTRCKRKREKRRHLSACQTLTSAKRQHGTNSRGTEHSPVCSRPEVTLMDHCPLETSVAKQSHICSAITSSLNDNMSVVETTLNDSVENKGEQTHQAVSNRSHLPFLSTETDPANQMCSGNDNRAVRERSQAEPAKSAGCDEDNKSERPTSDKMSGHGSQSLYQKDTANCERQDVKLNTESPRPRVRHFHVSSLGIGKHRFLHVHVNGQVLHQQTLFPVKLKQVLAVPPAPVPPPIPSNAPCHSPLAPPIAILQRHNALLPPVSPLPPRPPRPSIFSQVFPLASPHFTPSSQLPLVPHASLHPVPFGPASIHPVAMTPSSLHPVAVTPRTLHPVSVAIHTLPSPPVLSPVLPPQTAMFSLQPVFQPHDAFSLSHDPFISSHDPFITSRDCLPQCLPQLTSRCL